MGSTKILVLAPIKQKLEINTVKSYYTQVYVYSTQLLKITLKYIKRTYLKKSILLFLKISNHL